MPVEIGHARGGGPFFKLQCDVCGAFESLGPIGRRSAAHIALDDAKQRGWVCHVLPDRREGYAIARVLCPKCKAELMA